MFKNKNLHGFHIVDPSPWPIFASFTALLLTTGTVAYMHGYIHGLFSIKLALILLLLISFLWWRDIVREATFEGHHTSLVQTNIKYGMILFIITEIMFFISFFWAFFHFSFNPSIFIGGVWPPVFLNVLNPWSIPLLNTIILLSSGATITLAHHSIVLGSKDLSFIALVATVTLAIIFTLLQAEEYVSAPFSIYTTAYGSSFFMLTGFHGFHVIIGTIFISVCLIRLFFDHFTQEHHLGFETAAWYWHFVDVVWLFLFLSVYWWGY